MFFFINKQTGSPQYAVVAKHTKGVALVSVLWLVLLLTTVVLSLSRETQLAAKTAQFYAHEVQAKAKIEGAVNESIFWLLKGSPFAPLRNKMQSAGVDVVLSELESQTNINSGTLAQLEAVFFDKAIPNANKIAERILNFRDNPNESQAGKKYSFKHVFELTRVPGVSIEMVKELTEDITVLKHSISGRVVSLVLVTHQGSTRVGANVTVRFTGSSSNPYKILSWHWTTS